MPPTGRALPFGLTSKGVTKLWSPSTHALRSVLPGRLHLSCVSSCRVLPFTSTSLHSYHLAISYLASFSRTLHETLLCRCNGPLTFSTLLAYTFSLSGSHHSFAAAISFLWRTFLYLPYITTTSFQSASTVARSVRIDDFLLPYCPSEHHYSSLATRPLDNTSALLSDYENTLTHTSFVFNHHPRLPVLL